MRLPVEERSDTEQKILEAAHRVFLRQGTAGARTQEIADEAGVNKALLHYYFRSKEKLAQAVFVRAAQSVLPQVLQTLGSDLPLREKLIRVVERELDLLSENPYLPGYLLAEFQYRRDDLIEVLNQFVPIEQVRGQVLAKLQEQLDDEARAGNIRPTHAQDLVVALMSRVIFPFAAAPMLDAMLGLDAPGRAALVDRLRKNLPDALLRSLEP